MNPAAQPRVRVARAVTLDQLDLQVIQRIEIREAVLDRAREQRVGREAAFVPGDFRERLRRAFPFRDDPFEHVLAQLAVGHELRITRRDREIGLREHHVHVRQQVREERPGLVHLLQQRDALRAFGGVRRAVEIRAHRAAEAVPAGQQQPALAPREAPRNRAQILDLALLRVLQLARRRPAADVQLGDLGDRRRREEVVGEARGFIDERAVRGHRRVGQRLHRGLERGQLRRCVRLRQQRRLERRGDDRLEVAPADRRVRELARDHLALFGQADLAVHGARRLRQDRLVGRAAPAADRAAAAMEQPQRDLALAEQVDEREFRAIQLPVRREEAAVLVAVRVAEHHFLFGALMRDQRVDARQREVVAHDARRVAQVGDRLEQRDHHQAVLRVAARHAERAFEQARLLLQQQHLDEVADGFRMRNDVVAHRARTELRADLARLLEHAQLALRERRVFEVRRAQRARIGERGEQHAQLVFLRERRIVGLDAGAREQFGDHRLVDVGTLAQVDAREMEAEHFGRAHERREARRGERRAVVLVERRGQHLEIGDERFGVLVWNRTHGRRAAARAAHRHRAFAETYARARGEPRVDADQRAAIRFVDAVRRLVGRCGRERLHRVVRADQQVRHRQLGAQLVHLFQIVLEDHRGLAVDRLVERRRSHVRVAVAIAADPAAHLEERGHAGRQAMLGERGLDVAVQRGQFVEERRAVVRQRVLDLVADRQARVAQHPRLPQRGHARAQHRFVVLAFARGQLLVALREQARDVVLRIEDALALHFGRVRGQHRHDQRIVEEALQQALRRVAGGFQLVERVRDRAGLRRGPGQRVDAAAAVVVAVFRDVREMREIAERAHDAHRLLRRQLAQLLLERLRGFAVVLAAELDRGLADRLDHVEHRIAFLFAHDVAEQAAEEADVLEQRAVLVVARAGAGLRCDGLAGGGAGGFRRGFCLTYRVFRFRCRFRTAVRGGGEGARRGVGGGQGSIAARRTRRSGRLHDGFPWESSSQKELRKLRELRSSNQLRAAHPHNGAATRTEAGRAQAPGPGGLGRACYHCSIFNPVLRCSSNEFRDPRGRAATGTAARDVDDCFAREPPGDVASRTCA
ncbi:hypothetical protein F01_260221 [Burkholderia cenocepacia]|nr:hypothetical protein F01_260221 [Burkholderia cenocepacia]